jgi:hypothetical protein
MDEAIRAEDRRVINDWSTSNDTYDGWMMVTWSRSMSERLASKEEMERD